MKLFVLSPDQNDKLMFPNHSTPDVMFESTQYVYKFFIWNIEIVIGL